MLILYKKIITTFCFLLFIASLLLCGTTVMNAQPLGNILQKYKALDHKYRNDENVGMTCQELKTKYLKELRQFDEQINTLLGESQISMALDTLKENKVLIRIRHRIKTQIFKLTIAQELLNQPRTKYIADSLRTINQLKDRRESNRRSFDLLQNYERTLAQEVYQRYPNDELQCKAALDSVFLIMRALGTVAGQKVKRKIVLK